MISSTNVANVYFQIKDFSKPQEICRQAQQSTSELTWRIIGNSTIDDVEEAFVCHDANTYMLAVPSNITWFEALKMCSTFRGGEIVQATTNQEIDFLLGHFKNCELIWTPFSDHEEEGTFKNPFSGEVAATLPWYSNQPNGVIQLREGKITCLMQSPNKVNESHI